MRNIIAPRRILIIDDNEDAANLLAEMFALYGYFTDVAYGGLPGLLKVAEFAPDLVFLDIGMPDLDGYAVALRLRGMTGIRQPVLIAFTAWTDDEAKARAKRAGFDLHMKKTAPFEELLDAADYARPPAC
jgi:two-component system CheB/CheR fusion protein